MLNGSVHKNWNLTLQSVTTPVGLKHYDYQRWLCQTLDELSGVFKEANSLEVVMHVPHDLITALGDKKFDRIMSKAMDERNEDGSKRYPSIQRIFVEEHVESLKATRNQAQQAIRGVL